MAEKLTTKLERDGNDAERSEMRAYLLSIGIANPVTKCVPFYFLFIFYLSFCFTCSSCELTEGQQEDSRGIVFLGSKPSVGRVPATAAATTGRHDDFAR